jgi:hypothetical protein
VRIAIVFVLFAMRRKVSRRQVVHQRGLTNVTHEKHFSGMRICVAAGLLTLLAAEHASAQTARQRRYANPIDIDYRYNFEQHNEGISYRSGADPVIIVHRGEYYLFETIGDGYWHSRDQRFADQGTTLELRALTVGQAYWAAIESFDENGVSTLSSVVPIR